MSTPNNNNVCAPEFPSGALYGLSGRIVEKILPETESHPAALLLGLLAQYGNVIGRTAYYEVENTRHHANLFVAKVGPTAKGRKGTASARINYVMTAAADRPWFDRHFSSLSSGEGVISHLYDVKDDAPFDPDRDNRMFISAGEFAQTLSAMRRDGNTLSPVLRGAWDGVPLQLTTKNSPIRVRNQHVSIVADITRPELRKVLTESDQHNGFANRFLWAHVERTKTLLFGGKNVNLTPEILDLKTAIEFGSKHGRIQMGGDARVLWEDEYVRLTDGREDNDLIAAVTSRAEAQTVRLALIFALLDRGAEIREEHLRAALAVWNYCYQSAKFIFGGLNSVQERILDLLAGGAQNKRAIFQLFHGHRTKEQLDEDLRGLLDSRLLTSLKTGTARCSKRCSHDPRRANSERRGEAGIDCSPLLSKTGAALTF
ncbi:MAG: DUF3987 domain-containing protein [Candidatus Acidiferrales bacterium]